MEDGQWYQYAATQVRIATESGKAPWMQEVKGGSVELPNNPLQGVVYDGINSAVLSSEAALRGYKDSRWLTSNDIDGLNAEEPGLKLAIKFGAKGVAIAQRNLFHHPTDVNLQDGKKLSLRDSPPHYVVVYNGDDIQNMPRERVLGIDEYTQKRRDAFELNSGKAVEDAAKFLDAKARQNAPETQRELIAMMAAFKAAMDTKTDYKPIVDMAQIKRDVRSIESIDLLKGLYKADTLRKQAVHDTRHADVQNGLRRTVERAEAQKEQASVQKSRDRGMER